MFEKSENDIQANVIKRALELSGEKNWANISIGDIAYDLNISKSEMNKFFKDKDDILYALGKYIDRKLMDVVDIDEDEPIKDRLFEVLMERFDVLNEYRDGFKSIISSMKCDPRAAVISFPHIGKSMSFMFELAKVEISGIKGAIKIAGLTAIYLNSIRVWMNDDSSDMAKTMACLDTGLSKAEILMDKIGV